MAGFVDRVKWHSYLHLRVGLKLVRPADAPSTAGAYHGCVGLSVEFRSTVVRRWTFVVRFRRKLCAECVASLGVYGVRGGYRGNASYNRREPNVINELVPRRVAWL